MVRAAVARRRRRSDRASRPSPAPRRAASRCGGRRRRSTARRRTPIAGSTPTTSTPAVVTPASATSTWSVRASVAPGTDVHEPDGRRHDHGAEHGLRQVGDRPGEEQQHERDHAPRPAGRRPGCARRPRGSPRSASRWRPTGYPCERPAAASAAPMASSSCAGVDVLAVRPGVRARKEHGVGEDQQEQADGGGHERQDARVRQRREPDRRQAARRCRPPSPRRDSTATARSRRAMPPTTTISAPGTRGARKRSGNRISSAHDAHRQRREARGRKLADHVDQLAHRVGLVGLRRRAASGAGR